MRRVKELGNVNVIPELCRSECIISGQPAYTILCKKNIANQEKQAAGIRFVDAKTETNLAVVTSPSVVLASIKPFGLTDTNRATSKSQTSDMTDQEGRKMYLFAEIKPSGNGMRAWLDYSRVSGPDKNEQREHVCKI
jgi:hypothetical protein